jgi:hypothetical protein
VIKVVGNKVVFGFSLKCTTSNGTSSYGKVDATKCPPFLASFHPPQGSKARTSYDHDSMGGKSASRLTF